MLLEEFNAANLILSIMNIVRDCFGQDVRLTEERLAHILEHEEMVGMEAEIERVLQFPREVRLSRTSDGVKLFYQFYPESRCGAVFETRIRSGDNSRG